MIQYNILIPAYNVEEKIAHLLDKILTLPDFAPENIVIVNDGSTDQTKKMLQKYADHIKLIELDKNMGKGYALKQGIQFIQTHYQEKFVLFMDADLQHPPEAIPDFVKNGDAGFHPIIIGERSFNFRVMPFWRVFSNSLTSFVLSLLTCQKIKDSQCGYRLIEINIFDQVDMIENGFQFETEFILKAAQKNIPIHFLPIPTIYNDSKSNIRRLKDAYIFLKLIVKYKMRIT
jgi:dolichol-phosphate mannosyltransferase